MKTINKIVAIFLPVLCISCLPEDLVKENNDSGHGENVDFMAENIPFKMIYVEGGSFIMGATSEQGTGEDEERPTHQVTLKEYHIGETEVTQELWRGVMGTNPSLVKGNKLPVTNVSYNDVLQFISKLNSKTGKKFSLPTEAEWEFAARGGAQSGNYRYSGSNTANDVAWHSGNSKNTTQDVAQLSANELGIYDMSGNVYEICSDWMFSYAATSQTDPIGAEGEEVYHSSYNAQKVVKGGSKGSSVTDTRTAVRIGIKVSENYPDCGFRLALNSSAPDMPIASATIKNITGITAEAVVKISNTQKYSINLEESSATVYEITSANSARQTLSNLTSDSLAGFLKADTSYTGNIIKTKGSDDYSFSFTDLKPNTSYAVLFWLSTNGGYISVPLVQFITQKTGNMDFTAGYIPFTMIYVKGGVFTMGATSEQGSTIEKELPTHQVTLKDYYIGETEVTQELWRAVMGNNPSNNKGDKLPVTNISYNNIQEFITLLNSSTGQKFSLPTEAEWEFAARGGTKTGNYRYSGSNSARDVAWYSGNSNNTLQNVAQKNANELGIYDMSGNVYEICSDWMFAYTAASQTNPIGAAGSTIYHSSLEANKVMKGGSRNSELTSIRVANRLGSIATESYSDCGFRLALNSSATELPEASATIKNITATTAEAVVSVLNTQTYTFDPVTSSATAYEVTDITEARKIASAFIKDGQLPLANIKVSGNVVKTKSSGEYSFYLNDLKPNTSHVVLFWLYTSGGNISIPLVQFMTTEEDVTLSVSPPSLTFTAAGGYFGDVNVSTNATTWTVSSNSSWCKVTKYSALKQVGVSVDQNPYSFPRTAIVTIKAGTRNETVTVTQNGTEDYSSAQVTSCDSRIKFQIVSCRRSGSSVTFTYSITNTGMGKSIDEFRIASLSGPNSYIMDDLGLSYSYRNSSFTFGGKEVSGSGYVINALPLSVKMNATITLTNVDVNVKKIAYIKVYCYPYPTSSYSKLASEYYYFSDIPIY